MSLASPSVLVYWLCFVSFDCAQDKLECVGFGTAAKMIKQRSGFGAVLFIFACGVGYLI
jgi:hypothetical protein